MKPLVVALLAFWIFISTSFSVSAETIKLATLAPKGPPWYQALREMAEQWRTVSGGAIELRIYPGGVAGDEPDVVRKMRIGQLHAATLTSQGLSDMAPDIAALQLPMLIRSDAELNYIRERVSPEIEASLKAKGFRLLTWADAGWVYFFTQQPVVHPDDLKPLKLFVWSGDTASVDALRDAGYHPVPLAVTEIHTGLQSGLINAFGAPPVAALSFQWFTMANQMTNLKWVPLIAALVISDKVWQQLPDDLRPKPLEITRDAGARVRADVHKIESEAIEAMQNYGLVVHDIPPEVAAQWEERALAAYPALTGSGRVSAEMVSKVEQLRDQYRANQQ